MEKNNIIKITGMGALLLSAPFAALAADDGSNEGKFDRSRIDLSDEDKLSLMKAALDLQIAHANTLINELDGSEDIDRDRIDEIIVEFAELEESLDELDLEDYQKEELREIFFEFKSDSKELSKEFRSIIKDAFSNGEREAFREEFKEDWSELREEYGLPERKNKDHRGPKFTTEQIAQVDSEIAENLENGEITIREAMGQLKEVIGSMSEVERKELFSELGFERAERGEGKRSGFRN